MRSRKIRKVALSGLMTAIIAALTAYVRVSIPGGYIHPGDAAIALAAVVMGPTAALPAALGSCLADILGFPQYALFTLAIKGAMALVFGYACSNSKRMLPVIIASLAGAATLIGGYFLTDMLLGSTGLALNDMPWNAAQALAFAVSGIFFKAAGLGRYLKNMDI